jgi:hypothetical protein
VQYDKPGEEIQVMCCWLWEFTIRVADLVGVSEAGCDAEAEHHEDPVHFGDVDLAGDVVGGVHHLHAWEASQSGGLLDDGERRSDDGLACNHGGDCSQHEDGPVSPSCSKNKIM